MYGFRKRHLTSPRQFFELLGHVIAKNSRVAFAGRNGKISKAFAERINVAVSGVSECAYCSHLHVQWALKNGVSDEEIRSILSGDVKLSPAEEIPILAYAIHWAESNGQPLDEVRNRAVESVGRAKLCRAEAVMATVYMGNMCSNAIEARQTGSLPNDVNSTLAFALAWPVATFVRILGRYSD